MWSLDKFLASLKDVVRDPAFRDPKVNTSGLILIAVIIGIVSIALYANITNNSDKLKDVANAAIGSGSGAVEKEGAPPIPPPTEVIALRIYPIKSCRGIDITNTRLRKAGLTLDRNWMFIDAESKKFLTIRSDPSMTLIDTAITEGDDKQQMLEVSIHGTDGRVKIPAFPDRKWLEQNTTLETVNIWEQDTDGWVYADSINDMFSSYFNKSVKLVYKGPTARPVGVNGREELYGTSVPHHFADVMSLQVANEASINDLNHRLGHTPGSPEALTIERFRPNIIVRGRDDHPWEEDTWKRIRISTRLPDKEALYKLDVDVVARSARCQVPNVNPDTAEKHAKQPWDLLMKFRRVDEGGPAKYKPCFGMLAIPKNEGIIAVGAKMEVLETTNNHLFNFRAFKDL